MQQRSKKRARRQVGSLALLLLSSGLTSGCIMYALGPEHHVSGAQLPRELPQLTPGSSVQTVIDILGHPSSRTPLDSAGTGERLTWSEVVRPRACRRYFLGFVPLDREPRMTRLVVVNAQDGLVKTALLKVADRTGPGREENLLAPIH